MNLKAALYLILETQDGYCKDSSTLRMSLITQGFWEDSLLVSFDTAVSYKRCLLDTLKISLQEHCPFYPSTFPDSTLYLKFTVPFPALQ